MAKRGTAEEASDKARAKNRAAQEELDLVLAALAHPTRRQILLNLKIRGDAMSSGDIAARYSCSWPTVTRHLGVLKRAGLIRVRREGKSLRYELVREALERVWGHYFSYFEIEGG
jgi:DNA-binding transcriptional ArsR family regulator